MAIKKSKIKQLTFLVFDDYRYKEVKSFKFNVNYLKIFGSVFLVFFIFTVFSYIFLLKYYYERHSMLNFKVENKELRKKVEVYDKSIAEINEKLINLKIYEAQVKNVLKQAKDNFGEIDVSVGGKEFSTSKDFYILSDLKEKELFQQLDQVLDALNSEVDKRSEALIESVHELEKVHLTWSSMPTITPVQGYLSSNFGYRISPFSGYRVIHSGIDIATKYGNPIKATAKGIVVFTGYKPYYGNIVIIDHGNGYITRYGHCSRILVREGNFVKKGDIIARVGSTGRSTGPHVHYEVLVNGVPINPLSFTLDGVLS
jgi:murein DD-endopeptidase MepM/ murein hydrolase activator NlpD